MNLKLIPHPEKELVLPSLSGSDFEKQSTVFQMDDLSQVGQARRFSQTLCAHLQFDETDKGRVAIIVNELGNNLIRYAKNGSLIFRSLQREGLCGVEVLAFDHGPGFDVPTAMRDGFTTGTTPGTGLGAIQRQADEFDIYSPDEKGSFFVARVFAAGVPRTESFKVGAICVPVRGETVSGDAWSVHASGSEIEILAVDGLGHGPLAHNAACEAVDVFSKAERPATADRILQMIHGRLKSTRGAAVFLLTAKNNALDFVGVGNIRALHIQPLQSKILISQNGTAGVQIRQFRLSSQPWDGYGNLVLHSDGISTHWNLAKYPDMHSKHPSIIAALIYREYARGNDDATVVVLQRSL